MCGICGYVDSAKRRLADHQLLQRMTETISYRGPDASGYFVKDHVGLGFRRLSLVDLEGGNQPLLNEDSSIVLTCNGEIFNFQELRVELVTKGHQFRTKTDVEVLLHLYEEHGLDFLPKLNGQFAFALYDRAKERLILARDPAGICPLFYTFSNSRLLFASEIKSILADPEVRRAVDLTGLDQVLTFPGLISPRTMFEQVRSLPAGHYAVFERGEFRITEYWDLDFPKINELNDQKSERDHVEALKEILMRSVQRRLFADVPVGLYLSGGLDSSLISAITHRIQPEVQIHTFSIGFTDKSICESRYREVMLKHLNAVHHETIFDWAEIADRLASAVYHSEAPLKETYNTASLALSASARKNGIKAVLTGEGADELFAGYVGYRFDKFRRQNATREYDLEAALEDELRGKVWGDANLTYEADHYGHRETKLSLYSDELNQRFREFDCLQFNVANKERLRNRHFIHQRSYLDFKLRLSDHLVADHGDRVAMANSVEARYPFLDPTVIELARCLPPDMKLKGFVEKYILKEVAKGLLPPEIVEREKFPFHAPGSSYLLRQNIPWVHELLSPELIRKQGYFNSATVQQLKKQYMKEGFKLNLPVETDLLMIVLTFGIFLEAFNMPSLN